MTDDPIPRPLIVLGEWFRQMDDESSRRMNEAPLQTGTIYDIADLIDDHLHRLVDHVNAFADVVNEGLGRLSYEPDEYFNGVARRLEAELDGILDCYDEVRGLTPGADDFEGWSLLVEIHEETVYQIQRWLREVRDCVDDPVSVARKRSVSDGDDTVVNLALEMQPPRQVKQLTRWLEYRARANEHAWAQHQRRARRNSMIAGTLLGLWWGKD